MDYKDFLQKKTFDNLDQKSKDSLQQMLGNKSLINVAIETNELLQYISLVEKDYIPELEALAIDIIKQLYPIVERENINIDAKIVQDPPELNGDMKMKMGDGDGDPGEDDLINISPEIKRRIINGISQGASIRGAFAFYLFNDNLDKINNNLIEKYGALLRNAFGIYDSDEAVAMLLAMLANNQKVAGGTSEVEIENNEDDSNITIIARALNFPILLHEIVKGLFELISLQGFKNLGAAQAKKVAGNVDKLSNEPYDLRYGKFIYDALNDLVNQSNYDNPSVKEYFFAEVYQLNDDEFILFIENLVNNELTLSQKKWVQNTIRDIEKDIKSDDYDDLGIDERIHPLILRKAKYLLNEYSEKFINDTIKRWQQEDSNIDSNIAKRLIQRFDQVKQGLKPEILPLNDKLKQNKNYLNLDLYSYEDLENLIKAIPEKEKNIKKEAISRFVEKFGVDSNTALSYVSRFLSNINKLKDGVSNGIPELNFSAEEIQSYIPNNLKKNNNFSDPRLWKWDNFEQLMDAIFPTQKKISDINSNDATTDADKIYNKDGLEIYKGDDVHKCISYNPIIDNRKKYGWCVTQPGNTNYDYYRFSENRPTFYFIFDRTRSSAPNHSPFEDVWHAYVIQVNASGESYVVTNADNRADIRVDSWEEIPSMTKMDNKAWDRIKDKKEYFKPIPLSSTEISRQFTAGKSLNLDEFKQLSTEHKIYYIQGKAPMISKDILDVLPQFPKIKLEGRSTTLVNIAIDSGQEFPYSTLENYPSLAKRYAIFKFRHTEFGKKPIPLPFIQYLDENAKKEYLTKFENNLTFEYIEKYFGEQQAQNYVNNEIKKLEYLPPNAIKYIQGDELKKLYSIYSKLTTNWETTSDTNIDEEELQNLTQMPPQAIIPEPLTYENVIKDFSTNELNTITNLVNKYDKNPQYSTLLCALPFVVKDKGNLYLLLPLNKNNSREYREWVLITPDKKIINRYKNKILNYGYLTLNQGYIFDFDSDQPSYIRLLDMSKITPIDYTDF